MYDDIKSIIKTSPDPQTQIARRALTEKAETDLSFKIVRRLEAIQVGYFQGVSKTTVKVKVDVQVRILCVKIRPFDLRLSFG